MCRHDVDGLDPFARRLLAELLADIAAALEPGDPSAVVIGPVDIGPA